MRSLVPQTQQLGLSAVSGMEGRPRGKYLGRFVKGGHLVQWP